MLAKELLIFLLMKTLNIIQFLGAAVLEVASLSRMVVGKGVHKGMFIIILFC